MSQIHGGHAQINNMTNSLMEDKSGNGQEGSGKRAQGTVQEPEACHGVTQQGRNDTPDPSHQVGTCLPPGRAELWWRLGTGALG